MWQFWLFLIPLSQTLSSVFRRLTSPGHANILNIWNIFLLILLLKKKNGYESCNLSKFELQLHVSDIVFANFWNWTSTTCIGHCFCPFLKLNFNCMYRILFLPISEIKLQLHVSNIVFAYFWNLTSTTCIGHCICLFLKLNFNCMYRTLFLPISEINLQLQVSVIVFVYFWNWTSTTCIGHCFCLFLKLNFNYMYLAFSNFSIIHCSFWRFSTSRRVKSVVTSHSSWHSWLVVHSHFIHNHFL